VAIKNDFEKTSLRSRLREAHDESAKILARTGSPDDPTRANWCLYCKHEQHADCVGLAFRRTISYIPWSSDDYTMCRCLCPVCRQPKEAR